VTTLPAVAAAARAATIAALVAGEAAAGGAGESTAASAACGVERCLGCHGAFVGKAELLQDKLLAGGGYVWQRVRIGDVVGSAGEARVEAALEVETELRVGDDAADITKRVGGGLHLLGIVVDGGVALGHRVELVAQEDGVWGLVGLEEAPDGQPEGTRGLIWRRRQAEDIWPNRAKEPTANTGVSNVPGRVDGTNLLYDVGKESEFPTERGEERFPLVEVGPLQLQDHWDVVLDIDCCIGSNEDSRGREGAHAVGEAGGRVGRHGDLGERGSTAEGAVGSGGRIG
jgi:hypothetical protein